ncbi:nucleoid-associated protein [Escherichia coli]
MDINQIALHQLIKRDEQNLELVLRDSLLEPTETVVEMVAELHWGHSAKIKLTACLAKSELAQTLRLQRQGEEDFLAFSRAATGRLRDELAKYPFADGGFVLFCHYRYLAVEYLLVAVLSNLSSCALTKISTSTQRTISISTMRISSRASINRMGNQPRNRPAI